MIYTYFTKEMGGDKLTKIKDRKTDKDGVRTIIHKRACIKTGMRVIE
jgi:hypothetical protein